ncbi:hypothetical protein A9Q86_03170 [Flavobacteriales bacterium 33_180_T64]|nr:hypothetical protein A9Q86_03170 [Flavobacteriales bacterium 33_180_T64]
MQLYKSRGFGEYFQDTFAFLKQNGKHLFKHFFIINGIFLLILMVMTYFFSKFYTDIVFSSFGINSTSVVEDYLNENAVLFISLFFIFLIVALISATISYAFIPIYLKLYIKHNGKHFTTTDIITIYKANVGKILIFLVCGLLIGIPIILFVGLLAFILTITIIGILALPLLIGGVSLYYQGTLMEYLENKKGIWESFGYSWKLMSSKFWAAVACVGLFYLMSYLAQNTITIIVYVLEMINIFTDIEPGITPDPQELGKSMTIMMLIIFLLTFLLSSILNLILQLNQGIVFYSLKEDNENINTKSDIDLIGSGE